MSKPWHRITAILLSALFLVACSKSGPGEGDQARSQKQVTATVSIEADVEPGELRSIGLPQVTLENGKAKTFLDPSITAVPVHCIFRSSDGQVDIQTIEWTRDPGTQRLYLKKKPVSFSPGFDFSIAPGRKWYICGFIGRATIDKTKHTIEFKQVTGGTHPIELVPGEANIPYAFPWIELDLVEKDGGITFSPKAGVLFKPQGSMLHVKWGNQYASYMGGGHKCLYINQLHTYLNQSLRL